MALLEVCVDDILGLQEAYVGGADRVELCSALALGGLTPSPGLMEVAADFGLPAHVMIRPRSGGFRFGPEEVDAMRADIRTVRRLGLAGVVLGASLPDHGLDLMVLEDLIAEAEGLDLTLHRCIDLCPDVERAVDEAIGLGFDRILTSGGARVVAGGLDRLAMMMDLAGDLLVVMPGSGITEETWPLLAPLGVTEVHASCAAPLAQDAEALRFGFATGAEKRTDRARVAALKSVIA